MFPCSVINQSFQPSHNDWVVSLLNTGAVYAGHAMITVEGYQNERFFFGRYEVSAKEIVDQKIEDVFQSTMGNQQGYINDIYIFESPPRSIHGYFEKRNLSQYSSTSWYAKPKQVGDMIESIKAFKAKLDQAKDKQALLPLYQVAGSYRISWLGGNGGDNCVTWAEKQLAIAQINVKGSWFDYLKAKPELHVNSKFCSIQ